jgi:hypothetical protein
MEGPISGRCLNVTSGPVDMLLIVIWLDHALTHVPYYDIQLLDDIGKKVDGPTGVRPCELRSGMICQEPFTQLTEKWVYAK